MEIAFASSEHFPAIMRLWLDAFPEDTMQDVRDFLLATYAPNRCLVMLESGYPVSMAFLLPAELKFSAHKELVSQPFYLQYVYAAATLTPYRGQGLFGQLLTRAHEIAKEQGIQATFLHPAAPGLYSYYERFGYRTFFVTKTEKLENKECFQPVMDVANAKINRDNHDRIQRKKLLNKCSSWVEWPDFLVNYAVKSAEKRGGEVISIDSGWALCEPWNDEIWIREWLCNEPAEKLLRLAVAKSFRANNWYLRRPAASSVDSSPEPFGMLCPLTDEAETLCNLYQKEFPYMGLAFD